MMMVLRFQIEQLLEIILVLGLGLATKGCTSRVRQPIATLCADDIKK